MFKRKTKLRWRRMVRKQRRQVESISEVADDQLERHFLRRLNRLAGVKRFVVGWVGLVMLLFVALFLQTNALQDKYQTLQPAAGGIYTEGIVGQYTNANPIFATGSVDAAVSRLIFSGLFQYDRSGMLVPNLAESISHDNTETIYTLKLKPDLKWHDGQPLTADDVVFTFQTIQNADVRSHLQSNWRGVVLEASDAQTVLITLPDRLSGFKHSLTTGLIPKHILESVDPEQLRSIDFNTISPIGSGPFRFDAVEVDASDQDGKPPEQRIGLVAFDNYTYGKPQINRFTIRTFPDHETLEKAFREKEVTAMAGIPTFPDELVGAENVREIALPLSGQAMVFFKTTQKPLDQPEVRRALVLGADRNQAIESVGYPLLPADSPLLKSHIGYNDKLVQETGKIKEAKKILDAAGWKVDPKDGLRKRKKQTLSFRMYSEANSEYASITQYLQKQWRELGVDVQVSLQSTEDLKTTISNHNYDALLYSISTGADPDVYAYWHSTQADVRSSSRLNFSEYRSQTADTALEGGRSRSDAKIRAAKYEPFLKTWLKDSPALALYQPRYLYVAREPLYGFDLDALVTPIDRYANVHNWSIREEKR